MKVYLLIFVGILTFASCQEPATSQAETSDDASMVIISEKLTPEEFEKKLASIDSPQLVDLRTDREIAGGMLPNAVQINFQAADVKDKLSLLNKDEPIFVYCAAGGRSGRCANMLTEMGFQEIYDLKGGFGQWSQEGKPSIVPE